MKILILSLTLFFGITGFAQQYSIDWYKIAGGGGTSTSAVYSVSGTIGQHDASGPMTGGGYSLTGGFWSMLAAVQQPGAPTLFIQQSGNNAVLYWSASATGFVLENKGNLATPGGWSSVLTSPVVANGTNYVTNAIAPGNNFYRLHHP